MPIYTREFPVTFEVKDFQYEGDGQTVLGRIVPYGEVIKFVDPYDGGALKRERFVPGALAKQANDSAWARVLLSFQHDDGFHNTIGYGKQLEERDDGAYATFRLYKVDADKAREMMTSSHKGLSLEFEPRTRRDTVDDQGVIIRDSVHVRRVGITGDPAYSGARVLAVRERDDEAERVPTPHLDAVRADLAAMRRGEGRQ